MASRGVNKVILIGNLGETPSATVFPNGGMVTNLSLATSESWVDSSGQTQERTEWHRCAAFNKTAEILANLNLAKGTQIYIEGKLQTRKWQDQSGQNRYTTEIIVVNFQLLSPRQQGAAQAQQQPAQQQPAQQQPAQQQPAQQQPAQQQPAQQQPAQQQPAQLQTPTPVDHPMEEGYPEEFDPTEDIPF